MKMYKTIQTGILAALVGLASLASPVFAQDSPTPDQPPAQGQGPGHHGRWGHHHGGGVYMICIGQNLAAGTALPTFTPGQEQANKTAFKAFFTSSAFQAAAAKCTQYKPKWAAHLGAAPDSPATE